VTVIVIVLDTNNPPPSVTTISTVHDPIVVALVVKLMRHVTEPLPAVAVDTSPANAGGSFRQVLLATLQVRYPGSPPPAFGKSESAAVPSLTSV
jgi:hypothetical protein